MGRFHERVTFGIHTAFHIHTAQFTFTPHHSYVHTSSAELQRLQSLHSEITPPLRSRSRSRILTPWPGHMPPAIRATAGVAGDSGIACRSRSRLLS